MFGKILCWLGFHRSQSAFGCDKRGMMMLWSSHKRYHIGVVNYTNPCIRCGKEMKG